MGGKVNKYYLSTGKFSEWGKGSVLGTLHFLKTETMLSSNLGNLFLSDITDLILYSSFNNMDHFKHT